MQLEFSRIRAVSDVRGDQLEVDAVEFSSNQSGERCPRPTDHRADCLFIYGDGNPPIRGDYSSDKLKDAAGTDGRGQLLGEGLPLFGISRIKCRQQSNKPRIQRVFPPIHCTD